MASMKTFRLTLSLAAALGVATSARAQETTTTQTETTTQTQPSTTSTEMSTTSTDMTMHSDGGRMGPEIAISGNLGLGVGYVYKNAQTASGEESLKITDSAKFSIPVLVELGYRVTPRFYIGAFGSWEKVFTKENPLSCPSGFDCNTQQWRVGPEFRYHFSPEAGFDPWIGLGVGLEILKSHVKGTTNIPVAPGVTVPADVDTHVTDRGPTFARLAIGGDWHLSRAVALGPIATVSYGSYTVRTGDQKVTLPVIGTRDNALTPVDNGPHALFTVGLRLAFLPL
ncbi:hypothetical protein FGE12_27005 [Aggregicoccus sp. 17bor-14]|uniref:hypothetical protein n=1 Tax=Myxococcaceae TaxID=31 RepID=UPI00129CBBE0|nr:MULTISPECIES: hypothetical protein [Myxococcaceae]MBF5046093.1 hypothetical protein [Simulacricoccus sp. 17bor-14]MRI91822.1 hypothetical protein [Aggregicoccus sp. 17bor-14]